MNAYHDNTESLDDRPTKMNKNTNIRASRIKRKILNHVWVVRISIILSILIVIFLLIFTSIKISNKFNLPLYIKTAYNFATQPTELLASDKGTTNILVMGKGGGSHDGPDLTDTMMLVSISLTSNKTTMISIPRDLWVPSIRAKINSAYYWGNQKQVGGINFAKAITSEVVGVPIQYGIVIDFSGFKDIIDKLGGIMVNVPNSFTDYYYPIAGRENETCGGHDAFYKCRYETLHFVAGPQLMNGETALKFVRSRHAEGIEGTDIARELRQQKMIEGLKNKFSDKKTYKNIKNDLAILKVITNSIDTDIDYPKAGVIARRVYDSKDSIKSYIIPAELLVNPPVSEKYDMQSVFVPSLGNGKWEELQKWITSIAY